MTMVLFGSAMDVGTVMQLIVGVSCYRGTENAICFGSRHKCYLFFFSLYKEENFLAGAGARRAWSLRSAPWWAS